MNSFVFKCIIYTEYFICNSQFIGQILKYTLYVPNIGCSSVILLIFFFFFFKYTEPTLAQFWVTSKITFWSGGIIDL